MNKKLQAMVEEMFGSGIKLGQALKEFERRYIEEALNRSRGNQTLAALKLGVHRNTLAHKIHHHSLSRRQPD